MGEKAWNQENTDYDWFLNKVHREVEKVDKTSYDLFVNKTDSQILQSRLIDLAKTIIDYRDTIRLVLSVERKKVFEKKKVEEWKNGVRRNIGPNKRT